MPEDVRRLKNLPPSTNRYGIGLGSRISSTMSIQPAMQAATLAVWRATALEPAIGRSSRESLDTSMRQLPGPSAVVYLELALDRGLAFVLDRVQQESCPISGVSRVPRRPCIGSQASYSTSRSTATALSAVAYALS